MVRAGFEGDVKSEHVSQMIASLAEHGAIADRIALRLAVQERFGKLNQLARRFLNELRTSYERGISYEPGDFRGYRAPRAIQDWIAEHAPTAPASLRDSWFRQFTVCLLKDSEPKTVLVGLLAASRRWASSKGLKSSAEDAAFVRNVTLAISSTAIGANKIESILAGADAVEHQFRQALNHELDLERRILTQQDTIDALNKRVAALDIDLAKAAAAGAKGETRIAELEAALVAAGERYALLDRHSRGNLDQELRKQGETFKEKVSQEVDEALLALDRENPSLEIALRRLRRIQDILTK